MESPIAYGTGVSLRLPVDNAMYLASPGMADPRILLRCREREDAPILQFDRCVFQFMPVHQATKRSLADHHHNKELGKQRVTYGKVVYLVHQYSGLYVTVVRKPNESNASHYRVTLMTLEDAGPACRFRVMPRYKIRSEGDRVLDKDMIYLQQEISSLCLHSTLNAAGLPDDTVEISAFDTPTPFEVLIYDDSQELEDERHPTVNAGVATLIFHREKDALLTLPSALPTNAPSFCPPNVPFFRHMDKAVQNLSVETLDFGCSALWFFEHVDTTMGGAITVNTPFRIRNGVSGKYLAALRASTSSTYTLQLVELDTPEHLEGTVMDVELVSAIDSFEKVFSTKSFIKLCHRTSGMYLSTLKSAPQVSSLCLTHRSNLEDTLAIVTVPRERQQELSFLIGNVEFLSHYIQRFYQMQEPNSPLQPKDPVITRVVNRAAVSLSALIRFCTESTEENPLEREGIPINEHQQSMFEVNLHRTVMEVLLCPFVGSKKQNKMDLPLTGGVLKMEEILDPKYERIHTVCRLCYRLLKQMSKGSPYAAQLVEYVGFMQAQEGYKLHVADTLMEIFTNNPNLPPARCETDIRHFVHMLLTKGQSAGYLKFLSRLCVVNDTGVLHNQRLVCSLLLEQHRDDILQHTRVRDHQLMVLVKPKKEKKKDKKDGSAGKGTGDAASPGAVEDPTPKWVALAQFLSNGDKKAVKYFESSIEVLGALCIGADDQILAAVASFLTRDVVIAAIQPSFQASEGLRASYFRVALHLYLRQSLRTSSHHHTRLHFTCGSLVLPSVEAEDEIKELVRVRQADPDSSGANFDEELIRSIKSQSLVYLRKYTAVTGAEGLNDLILTISYIWHAIVAHQVFERDEIVQVCAAVSDVLDGKTDRLGDDRYALNEGTALAMRTKRGLIDFLKTVLVHETDRISDNVVLRLKGMAKKVAIREAEEAFTHLNNVLFNTEKLFPILTDMLHYQDSDLVSRSLDLVVSICNAGGTVASRISDAEPVSSPQSIAAFKCFARVCMQLSRNMTSAGNIIDEEELVNTIREVTHFDPNAQVAQAASSAAGSTPRTRSTSMAGKGRLAARISTIIAMNRVLSTVQGKRSRWRNEDEVVLEYSRLLFRSGIHSHLLKVFVSAAEGTELQVALLEFFRVLSTTPASAVELSKYITHFVECLRHPATTNDAAAIILRLLKTNKSLAASLDEGTIVQFVTQLKIKTDTTIAEGLEHVVLGEYPILKNQRQVLALLISNGILKGIGDVDVTWPTAQLAFNSAIVDLVACCCVDNGTARSMVNSVLSAEGTLKVLVADKLPAAHLCPYFKLLCTAYLSSENDWTAQELQQLRRQWTESKMWWTLMQAVVLKRLVIPEGGLPLGDEELIFAGMLPALTSYFHNHYDSATAKKSSVCIPLADVVRKLVHFAQQVLELDNPVSEMYMGALQQTFGSLREHTAANCSSDLRKIVEDIFTKVCQMTTKLSSRNSGDSASTSASGKLDGADQFADRWVPFSNELLKPLVALYKGSSDVHQLPLVDPYLHRMHIKIINHLFRGDLTDEATVGIIATMRFVLEELEEGSGAHVDAQIYFNSIGALRMCTEVISGSSDLVIMEAFKLAIAILEGGNSVVQDHLLNFFASTDERFFHESTHIVHKAIEASQQHRARELHGTFYSRSRGHKLQFKFVIEVFRFLQLMCEGHHLGLQNYLRDQMDNLRSVNVVKEVVGFLQELVANDLEPEHFPVLQQTLALLSELCQGPCHGNQQLIVTLGSTAVVNTLLSMPVSFPLSDEEAEVMEIKKNVVTLLIALLEGCTSDTLPLAMLNELPVSCLGAVLEQLIATQEFKAQHESVCEVVYGVCILLHTLIRCINDTHNKDCIDAEALLHKYATDIGMLGKIEIERGERIENVFFRVPPICAMLTEEAKQKLLWSVDRSGQGSKLSDFLDKADELIFDMEAAHNVTEQLQHNKALMLLSRFDLGTYDNISLIIAIAINILFVAVIQDAKGLMDHATDWLGVEGFIRVLAYLQVMCTLIISFMDGCLNFPLVLYKQKKEIANPTIFQKAKAIVHRSETSYRAVAVLFALAGLFVSDFFFAFHLLGLIGKSSALINVIVAVTANGKSLLLTGLLGCIFVYLFSIIGFVMFQDHFNDSCHTLATCVLHILTTGLRQGGGIGDAMEDVKHGDAMYLSRTLYDFVFWAMMIVIFLNILFGIIIDTFAELRDEKSKKEEDMRTKCFICGIDSYTFDRYGEGFEKHVKEEHNMWQYLYFLHHLRRKEPTEYTGQESFVADCVKSGDIAFFPAGRCSSLKDMPKQSGGDSGDHDDERENNSAIITAPRAIAAASSGGQQGQGGSVGAHHHHHHHSREDDQANSTANNSAALNEATSNMLTKILSKLDSLSSQKEQGPAGFSLFPSRGGGGSGFFPLQSSGDDRARSPALENAVGGASGNTSSATTPVLMDFHQLQQQQQVQMVIRQQQAEIDNLRRKHAAGVATIHLDYQTSCSRLIDHTATLASIYFQFELRVSQAFADCAIVCHARLVDCNGGLSDRVEQLLAQIDGLNELRCKERALHLQAELGSRHSDKSSDGARNAVGEEAASPSGRHDGTALSVSISDLMKEGQNYIRLMRQVTQEGRALHKSASPPEKSARD